MKEKKMSDEGTMKDHIEDLMKEVETLRIHLNSETHLSNTLARQRDEWRSVANDLYLGLIQMKKRRGVHIDDIEYVFDALEKYEDMQIGKLNE
jgi:hypothetical protein